MRRRLHRVAPACLAVLAACSGSTAQTDAPVPAAPVAAAPAPVAPPAPPEPAGAVFARECRAGLERARQILPTILAVQGPRTVENTLAPYNELRVAVERSSAAASLANNVHPDKGVRDAAEACEQEATAFESELGLNRALYDAIGQVQTRDADADTRRLVDHVLRGFRRAGVDKDEATRARLKEIDDRLVVLGQDFARNIVDDVRHIALRDPADLKGMPQDYIDAHKPDERGQILITTNYPDYMPFMAYADSAPLRKQLYVAFRARGDRTNGGVLKQLLELRAEKARLLGYASWADYATEDKMMKSAAAAARFIERVARTSRSRSRRDYAELLRFKKTLDPRATRVEEHERSYLENKVKAKSYRFDAQEVRPYLPYAQVERGLLEITAEMYGIQYRPVAAADANVWHEDVRAFDVMRGQDRVGRILLDMHPRDGKYQHAAQFTRQSGVVGTQLPEGVLVCNFPNPRTDGNALMEHDEVVTMFHEFGHLMHHVLGGQQRWIEQSGVATEWDFVEAPSQMFEEWAWSHDTLARFARHAETGAVIPDEMVQRMRKADKFGIGIQTAQQMFYASVSLRFHTANPAELDMAAEVKRLQAKYTPFKAIGGTSFHTNFGHLNGYSALYYTYMWSLVIAKDLLTPFRANGLMNPTWTAKYRDTILAQGGTKDAAVLVKEFLGREFDFKAFEDYLTKDSL